MTTFREPTGKPPWPITLIAGAEKAGKSYSCALASSSDLIGNSFWIGVGEDDPDEYGAIPGARFKIAQHDGTYRSILASLEAAAAAPRVDGKPNLIILDSATRLWELLSDEAQVLANRRRKNNNPDQDSPISMDLWNRATDRWQSIVNVLRRHEGPSLVTARLDVVTVLDDAGKPTKEKTSKIKSQKSLPYDVGIVVEMPARGETFITGARSLKMDVRLDERKSYKNFSVHELWTTLGLGEADATAPRQHADVDATASAQEQQRPAPVQQQDAAVTSLNQYRHQQPDWAAEIDRAKNNREMLLDLLAKAKGMQAPQETIDQITAAGKALAARTA